MATNAVRITIINQFYKPDLSPTAHLAASLAEHRASLGDQVTVVTSDAGYVETAPDHTSDPTNAARPSEADATESPTMVKVLRIGTPGGGKSSLRSRLSGYVTFTLGGWFRVLVLPRQDVIVSMTTPPFIVLAAFLHRVIHRSTKIVLWSMDVYPDTAEAFDQLKPQSLISKVLRRLNHWLYPRLDHLVVLDEAMGTVLSQYSASSSKPPSTAIPNWEPLAAFPPPQEQPERWSEYGANANLVNRAVVAYLGNTGTGHSFETVIQAAGRLANENVAFLFVGGGVRRPTLETAALALGEGRGAPIVLYDYVSRETVPKVLAGAVASLITLDERAWGLMSPSKLHSALAAGVPIIYVGPTGTNVDEAIVTHGCGVSLRNGDVDGLVAAIREISQNSNYHAGLARAARKAFETSYCDTATLPIFDRILAEFNK